MRRIFAVLILLIILTMAVLIVWDLPRNMLLGWLTTVAGPTFVNTLVTTGNTIIDTLGIGGFAVVMMIVGLTGGWITHYLWVKADWSLRRWGSQRIQKDLGAPGTTVLPSTPLGATTRPTTTQTVQNPPQPEVTPPPKQDKEEEA